MKFAFAILVATRLFASEPTQTRSGPFISGSFLQLTPEHRTWSAERWDQLFDRFRTLRLQEIIVQWTVSDGQAFYASQAFPSPPAGIVEDILSRADSAGLRVTLGLARKSDYWEQIEQGKGVAEYLHALRKDSVQAAAELAEIATLHPSFAGWYLPEEIDDINWQTEPAQVLLIQHLSALVLELRRGTPQGRLSISMFCQHRMAPKAFAQLCKRIAESARIERLLFQDGVGVGKLSLEGVQNYLSSFGEAGLMSSLQPVIEIFQQTAGPPLSAGEFHADPAPIERIEQQLRMECKVAARAPIAFSVPEYMTPEAGTAPAKLYNDYLSLLRRTQGEN